MTKKIIKLQKDNICPGEFTGTLAELRIAIDNWIGQYGADAELEWEPDFYYLYEANPSPRFNIITKREETDKEYATRLKTVKKDDANRLKLLRAEVERLEKEIGENNE